MRIGQIQMLQPRLPFHKRAEQSRGLLAVHGLYAALFTNPSQNDIKAVPGDVEMRQLVCFFEVGQEGQELRWGHLVIRDIQIFKSIR